MTGRQRADLEAISQGAATDEAAYLNRRRFMLAVGAAGIGSVVSLPLGGCTPEDQAYGGDPSAPDVAPTPSSRLYPAPRSDRFVLDRPLTKEDVAATYNNFYEFSTRKSGIAKLAERFQLRPWEVEVGGLVAKPQKLAIDELVKLMPLEERLYRFRCVEAWAMAVPWTGFSFQALMDRVEPLSAARFVRLVTFMRPEQAPRQVSDTGEPWPYAEGLSIAEAANELTMLVTGIYGHELPKQHGAPIRLIVPWKYGYKSIKSIVKIEFTAQRPATFWNTIRPEEYDFTSNVNPEVPHPRWSQATERMIGADEKRPTLPYNGYGKYVAHLYA